MSASFCKLKTNNRRVPDRRVPDQRVPNRRQPGPAVRSACERTLWQLCGGALLWLVAGLAGAAELPVFQLVLKDHLYSPSTLYVPAGQKIKIIISNQDPNPEEFESFSLNREKVILGHSKGVVYVGPLKPGQYPFIGEYNPDSAKGVLIALTPEQWQQKVATPGGPGAD